MKGGIRERACRLKSSAAGIGVRPGVRVSVQPKRLPFFKVGKELKERVNAGKQVNGARRLREEAAAPAPIAVPVTTTGPLTDSGATAAATAEPVPTGTPTRATA